MKKFLDDNFLLQSPTAEVLYHQYARKQPIIDYHNHLSPQQIAENTQFDNITQVWLYGDHYKWRAMRAHGIAEYYITGAATDKEKFMKWAETVPYTMRNPLYHWTHLELQRYFGIYELLSPATAERIYEETSAKLQLPAYRVQGLLEMMNVELVCTTDDPVDSLEYHQEFARQGSALKMVSAFRPDKAMNSDDVVAFKQYVAQLALVVGQPITDFSSYLAALKSRHDYFHEQGCRLSDHGLEQLYVATYTDEELELIFAKLLNLQELTAQEQHIFKAAMLVHFGHWDHERGWVQQFHIGALRNNNTRKLTDLGPDTGWDSIGDFSQAEALAAFLNRLDKDNKLAKTIIYNLNPADNEVIATMVGNFNDGSTAGKVQFGAAWWFLDQKDGITRQLNILSTMGLISNSVGMLTDSRSFLSFPRHEYFRRILCNLFAEDIEEGELPDDIPWIGSLIEAISYGNAKRYFDF